MSSGVLLDIVIYGALAILGALFVYLEARAVRCWEGAWKVAAIVPAMVIGWVVLGIILNPAAHTLWPIEIILWLIPAIVALLLIRAMVRSAERLHSV